MAGLRKELSAGTLHPRENLFKTQLLAWVNADLVIDCDGCGTVTVDWRGAGANATLTVEGSVDNFSSFQVIPMLPINQAAMQYAATFGGTTLGTWMGAAAGYSKVRVRVTAFTAAGTVTIAASITQFIEPDIAPLSVSSVGTSGAALTVTAPSPGTGLRLQILEMVGEKFAATALAAAATPLVATTSGLPGTPSVRFPNAAANIGELSKQALDNKMPIPATAQSTAVTLVCPATPGVIWSGFIRYKLSK